MYKKYMVGYVSLFTNKLDLAVVEAATKSWAMVQFVRNNLGGDVFADLLLQESNQRNEEEWEERIKQVMFDSDSIIEAKEL